MKRCIMTWALLALAVTLKAETGFVKALPAEDFATAGLQKLTPEELGHRHTLLFGLRLKPFDGLAVESFDRDRRAHVDSW